MFFLSTKHIYSLARLLIPSVIITPFTYSWHFILQDCLIEIEISARLELEEAGIPYGRTKESALLLRFKSV